MQTSWWHTLHFHNAAQIELGITQAPEDPLEEPNAACFTSVSGLRLETPRLVAISARALSLLGADDKALSSLTAEQLSGNELPEGASPAAHCYCGHQQGHFAGTLGDGAAVSLGEVGNLSRFELHLKGCGSTPFTRSDIGNGRKSLGSVVREFLVSEALAALRVPTTRSLSVVAGQYGSVLTTSTGPTSCGVLLRAATTFLRFGSFEVALTACQTGTGRAAPFAGNTCLLRRLSLHCIHQYFPHLEAVPDEENEDDEDLQAAPKFCALVLEVVTRTAELGAA